MLMQTSYQPRDSRTSLPYHFSTLHVLKRSSSLCPRETWLILIKVKLTPAGKFCEMQEAQQHSWRTANSIWLLLLEINIHLPSLWFRLGSVCSQWEKVNYILSFFKGLLSEVWNGLSKSELECNSLAWHKALSLPYKATIIQSAVACSVEELLKLSWYILTCNMFIKFNLYNLPGSSSWGKWQTTITQL